MHDSSQHWLYQQRMNWKHKHDLRLPPQASSPYQQRMNWKSFLMGLNADLAKNVSTKNELKGTMSPRCACCWSPAYQQRMNWKILFDPSQVFSMSAVSTKNELKEALEGLPRPDEELRYQQRMNWKFARLSSSFRPLTYVSMKNELKDQYMLCSLLCFPVYTWCVVCWLGSMGWCSCRVLFVRGAVGWCVPVVNHSGCSPRA